MSFRSANFPVASADSPSLPVVVLVGAALVGMAVFAGLATAALGSMAGHRAIYYVAVLVVFVIGGLVTLTRKEPLRFAFLALIVLFPIASAEIPPGRFELTVFHAVMSALAIGLIWKILYGPPAAAGPLFPTRVLLLACLLVIPCIVFSRYPLWSLKIFTFKNLTVYFFLLFALYELQREKGFERLVLLLSIASIFLAMGVCIDYFLQMNLSLQGSNVNQSTFSDSGLAIYRAGGFFQDPQKAGAYLACMITFLVLLSVRGRFRGLAMRHVVGAAIAFGLVALLMTISRSAILACLGVTAFALLAFNSWNAIVKLVILGAVAAIALSMALVPLEIWLGMLPVTIAERFQLVGQDLGIRVAVMWFDTWDMFADHPLTGIGFGSFAPYLMETRPTVFNYYGIGVAEGITYIPNDPENGYLKILYETGILGSLAALLIVGDVLRRAVMLMADRNTNPHTRTEVIAASAALATFGTTFVTLYVAGDERLGALFAVFLAVILRRSLQLARAAPEAP
jgi:O-antigen ligase